MYSTPNKKRMAGDEKFQADLQNAQMQSEAQENSKTAGGGSFEGQAESQGPRNDNGDSPQKDPQEFLKERTTEISNRQRNAEIRDEIAADPEKTKQRLSGVDRSKYDFEGYSDSDIVKAMQGDEFGERDYARLTGKSMGGDNDDDKKQYAGGSPGFYDKGSPGYGGEHFDDSESGKGSTQKKVNSYMPAMRQGTFADQAVKAAAKNNPVDFKALDQRIHDRPLYMQAKADIKHSETFGDTWSWDSAPKWNTERFKAGEQENRYEDVMKENKYD